MNAGFSVNYSSQGAVIEFDGFDAPLSLDCGQAFRWSCDESGLWHGVAGSNALTLKKEGNKTMLYNVNEAQFEGFWRKYFDLDRDYDSLKKAYSADESLKKAVEFCGGIRILHQEPWEALCSFIISQNNNIPRIKGIVERLCALLGDEIEEGIYAFPSAEKIAQAGVDALAPIRSGFRAKYIYDAACRVSEGRVDFDYIASLELDEAINALCEIKGVGPKVASCALLYGMGRADAFPVDVWVKRILSELYPDGMPECTNGTAGIAQQYLFHWRRNSEEFEE